MKLKPLSRTLALVTTSLVVAPLPVSAAELEEIIVTSNKREQSVQDVSLSVTAVTADDLIANGINDITRLDSLAPGLKFGISGNDPRPAIRGARTEEIEANDVAVAFYTDGVYKPRHGQALAGFIDIDRVEVLRGPQGTLFGRNAFGGAINVFTKKPDFEESDYGASVTLGDYDLRRVEGFANLPLSDVAAFRISAVNEDRDPYVENTFNSNAGLKDSDYYFIRAQLAFAPSDDFDISLKLEEWDDSSNGNGDFGYAIFGAPVDSATGNTNGVTGVLNGLIGRSDACGGCGRFGAGLNENAEPVTGNPYRINSDFQPVRDVSETTFVAEANWGGLGFADLKVIAAISDYEELRLADSDLSPNDSIVSGNDITSDTTTFEVQLTSNSDGAFEWVVGFFYLQEDLTNAFLFQQRTPIENNAPVPGAANINEWASFMSQIQLDTESFAFYGQGSYSISETFRAIAGIRYTQDDRSWDIFTQNPDDLSTISFTELSTDNANEDWSETTWKVGFEYDATEDTLWYGTISTGFLAGNAQGAFSGDGTYDQQTVTAYELGFKSILLDGSVRLNVALYRNEFEDLLSTEFIDIGGTTTSVQVNAGEVNANGLEVELDWAATEELQIGLRASISDAEYGNFVTANNFQEGGNIMDGAFFQLDGNQVALTPDFTLTLLGSYVISLGDNGSLTPAVNFTYTDDYRGSDQPYFYAVQDSYTLTDLTLTWKSANQNWSVQGFIRNLEDEAVLTNATRFGGNVAAGDFGAPQTFGVRVGYNY